MSKHLQQPRSLDVPQRAPGLHWGIKDSFLDYVASTRDGQCTVGGGASPSPSGVFLFEPDRLARSAWPERRFTGEVRFEAHGGMLFVRVVDPWISVEDGQGVLSVLDPDSPDAQARLTLATFALDVALIDPEQPWAVSDVRLAAAGTSIFDDVYPEREPFAPLLVVPGHSHPGRPAVERDQNAIALDSVGRGANAEQEEEEA
ncbi:MAG: HtaA domain-containing protein [Nocardioides sp.]|uniref:HtaA domain-containing protein n=1 Tax=Nocardioides sp. TaxID=35761 RepID=UPI0039E27141